MTVRIVTSCSLTGWKEYGLKCMQSIALHWPPDIEINLVSEDNLPWETAARGRKWVNWPLSAYGPANKFYLEHAGNNQSRGLGITRSITGNRKPIPPYSYRHDAWRFSKKIFAIALVASANPNGKLIWLDADTLTLHPIPHSLFDKVLPDDKNISFLDRPGYHSECGFVGYNLDRPGTMEFIGQFADLYASGRVFSLAEWHDSWVFDWLRKNFLFEKRPLAQHKIPHSNPAHPFVYSELGNYMDHMKGGRKKLGMSVEHPRFKRKKP